MYRRANGVQTNRTTERTTDRQSQLQRSFTPKNKRYTPEAQDCVCDRPRMREEQRAYRPRSCHTPAQPATSEDVEKSWRSKTDFYILHNC